MEHIKQSIFRLEAIKSYTSGSSTISASEFRLPKIIILLWFLLVSCVATSLLLSIFQIPVIITGKIYSSNAEVNKNDIVRNIQYLKIIIPNNSLKYIKSPEIRLRFEQTQDLLECRVLSLDTSDKTLLAFKDIKINKSSSDISFIEASCKKPISDSISDNIFENSDGKTVYLELGNAQVYSFFLFYK